MTSNQQSVFIKKIRDVISSSGVPFEFSSEVIKEAAEIESEFKWPSIGKRADLRGKTTFTLGSLEVAFSIERLEEDFVIGIHSADVANLFPVCSPLDEAAFSRGKSAVFPEKKHSMIPETIASRFCSLEEGEECFTVSVVLRVSEKGEIKSVDFLESVIKVTANCEPEEVEALLFNIDVSSVGFLRYKYYAVLEQLEYMFVAGANLKNARERRKAEEIDTAVRTFSRKGIRRNVVSVGFKKLSDPEMLVREIISAAGIAVAKALKKNNIPCPNRFRPPMSKEGKEKLRAFLKTVFIDTSAIDDENLVRETANKARGGRIEELILSKIKKLLPSATCSLESGYHCGIGSDDYVRFAYPADRYGDLCVQRLIKAIVSAERDKEPLNNEYLMLCASRAVLSVSENEPKVKALEKRVSDLYVLEYLSNNKNKNYEGTVWTVNENINENSVEVFLDNSCLGILKINSGTNSQSNLELKYGFVPGQRGVFRVSEIDMEKETAVFDFLGSPLEIRS